jgi:3'(2'), 5'-bisphosphate nucleotidase
MAGSKTHWIRRGAVATEEPLEELIAIARAAGRKVLDVYAGGCTVHRKDDGSPVTEADRRAQEVICRHLTRLAPDLPIVAEEDCDTTIDSDQTGRFWLVDPLDGTKEFLSRNGEFTVNIALIERGAPVYGVIFAPAIDRIYASAPRAGALVEDDAGRRVIAARQLPIEGATVVSSRSHGDPDAIARCVAGQKIASFTCAGSSLKFCLLAAGEADLYPRLGRTMEWDTAAGDAILRSAGGCVTDLRGRAITYGKPGFENPHFIARGRPPANGSRAALA